MPKAIRQKRGAIKSNQRLLVVWYRYTRKKQSQMQSVNYEEVQRWRKEGLLKFEK